MITIQIQQKHKCSVLIMNILKIQQQHYFAAGAKTLQLLR
jgi:hypothetical protein